LRDSFDAHVPAQTVRIFQTLHRELLELRRICLINREREKEKEKNTHESWKKKKKKTFHQK